jgi:hypothetical protein
MRHTVPADWRNGKINSFMAKYFQKRAGITSMLKLQRLFGMTIRSISDIIYEEGVLSCEYL